MRDNDYSGGADKERAEGGSGAGDGKSNTSGGGESSNDSGTESASTSGSEPSEPSSAPSAQPGDDENRRDAGSDETE